MQREDTYALRVAVDGRDMGVWDKMEGGMVDSEETTYRPGALADQVTLGGARSTETVTVTRLYTADVHANFHWLASRAGRGAMTVSRQPLDAEGRAWGRPVVWTGKLKSVKAPDVDSEGNDAALIALEMTVQGTVQ